MGFCTTTHTHTPPACASVLAHLRYLAGAWAPSVSEEMTHHTQYASRSLWLGHVSSKSGRRQKGLLPSARGLCRGVTYRSGLHRKAGLRICAMRYLCLSVSLSQRRGRTTHRASERCSGFSRLGRRERVGRRNKRDTFLRIHDALRERVRAQHTTSTSAGALANLRQPGWPWRPLLGMSRRRRKKPWGAGPACGHAFANAVRHGGPEWHGFTTHSEAE